jgi:hypothetical protein
MPTRKEKRTTEVGVTIYTPQVKCEGIKIRKNKTGWDATSRKLIKAECKGGPLLPTGT